MNNPAYQSKTNQTLFIFGSGFSASLGLLTTKEIDEAVKTLLDVDIEDKDYPTPIKDRIGRLKKNNKKFKELFEKDKYAQADIENTLSILFDGNGAKTYPEVNSDFKKAKENYINLYGKYFKGAEKKLSFRLDYINNTIGCELLSLKALYRDIKKTRNSENNQVSLDEILTLVHKAIESNVTIPSTEVFPEEKSETPDIFMVGEHGLEKVLLAYKYIVFKLFKHLMRFYGSRRESNAKEYLNFLDKLHKDFAGIDTLSIENAAKKESYLSNIGYITFNWDPVLPLFSMKVNNEINKELKRQSSGRFIKKIYMDLDLPLPMIKMSNPKDSPVSEFSTSESTACLINSLTKKSDNGKYGSAMPSKFLLKIIKLFAPHGLYNLRICSRCQNAFIVLPESFDKMELVDLHKIFLLDPIPCEYDLEQVKNYPRLEEKYKDAKPDEIDCPVCGHPTRFRETYMEIQSILKSSKPPIMSKIYYDYGDLYSKADHIISIGYSFPRDDILENLFLDTMKIKTKTDNEKKPSEAKFTSIDKIPELGNKKWFTFDETMKFYQSNFTKYKQNIESLELLNKYYPKRSMRFNFMGFPDILKHVSIEEIVNFKEPG